MLSESWSLSAYIIVLTSRVLLLFVLYPLFVSSPDICPFFSNFSLAFCLSHYSVIPLWLLRCVRARTLALSLVSPFRDSERIYSRERERERERERDRQRERVCIMKFELLLRSSYSLLVLPILIYLELWKTFIHIHPANNRTCAN